jgi:hypothetical protein
MPARTCQPAHRQDTPTSVSLHTASLSQHPHGSSCFSRKWRADAPHHDSAPPRAITVVTAGVLMAAIPFGHSTEGPPHSCWRLYLARTALPTASAVVGSPAFPLLHSTVAHTSKALLPAHACRGPVLVASAVVATLWSGISAAKLVVRRSPSLSHVVPVLTYTCSLLYASFALLTVY